MATDFHLYALLEGHSSDVRSLAHAAAPAETAALSMMGSTTPARLFSTSRDGSARSWQRLGNTWSAEHVWHRPNAGFLNSSCFLPSPPAPAAQSTRRADWLLVGSLNGIVEFHPVPPTDEEDDLVIEFPAHNGNVCSMRTHSLKNILASSSWDMTATVWTIKHDVLDRFASEGGDYYEDPLERLFSLAHEAAVWDVLVVEIKTFENYYVTACADGLVRLWENDTLKLTLKGHEGPVRCLEKVLPRDPECHLFASASNDGSIRLWSLEGDAITVLDGHDSFIYSMVSLRGDNDQRLVSSGEEGIVRIWSAEDGEMEQELLVPALSVWCLTALPDGDLAIGCSDHRIWLFSKDASRTASSDLQEQYETTLKAFKDTLRVKSETEAAPRQSEPRTKMSFEGEEYDFVLGIDVRDDERPLKLPFNIDDPAEIARNFVQTHSLSENYVDRIADFIQMHVDASK